MSHQKDREEFVAIMAREGVPVDVARKLMRASASLSRIAELQCSSEAADRDRIPCPGFLNGETRGCLCDDYGSIYRGAGQITHGSVPRVNVQEWRIELRLSAICAKYKLVPEFQGDPRGAVVKLKVPSGKTNDWGQTGICVP